MSLRTYTGPTPSASPAFAWSGSAGSSRSRPLRCRSRSRSRPTRPLSGTSPAITVVVFFLASVVHATAYHRWRGFFVVAVAVPALGWVAERFGSATGYPFGDYFVHRRLGPQLLDVPAVVAARLGDDGLPHVRRGVRARD